MPSSENSFGALPDLAAKMPRISERWAWAWRIFYVLRSLWRHIRVTWPVTRLLGPQYRRSRDMIEIDITYLCNLHCLNCNRSIAQARENLHMTVEMIRTFVDQSIQYGKRWRRIRVLGGEPTLHPQFHEIIAELRKYRKWNDSCIIEVVSNGFGTRVNRELERLPNDVMVDNTAKKSSLQPHFGPFNLAPIDDPKYFLSDYSNACSILRDCGMGLTPMGYYPCAVAGGIDRIIGEELGLASLPSDQDDMSDASRRLCSLCGRFRDGHFVPRILRPALAEERLSPSWKLHYERWHKAKNKDIKESQKSSTPSA